MSRVAAIDCGTNSVRLLVADVDGSRLVDVVRRMEIVRLGQGVDRTGRFAAEALERTFAALRSFASDLERCGSPPVRMVATSATRDAANREEFVTGVREILGVDPEVVTGMAEAALSYEGATRELAGCPVDPPYLVVDIGGGSTEFVLGDGEVHAARSVDIGCVRMSERHFAADPPTAAQVAAATDDIDSAIALAGEEVPFEEARTLVGLAGSVTTVAAIALELPDYDPERIHHARIPADRVRDISERLLYLDRAQRAAIPVMHPGRVDVIAAGALVLRRIIDRLGCDGVVASEHDILDGIAYRLADG